MSAQRPDDYLDGLDEFDPVPEGLMPLDPRIRPFVLILRSQGVETFESCQGGEGHACVEPKIRFHGDAAAGYKAFAVAVDHGIRVQNLRRGYQVHEGAWLSHPYWEMTFRDKDLPER